MLSILIPTYHYNALPLATALHEQGLASNIPFEIICFDDGSPEIYNTENQKINMLQYAHFASLPTNVGLSQNRNLLAQKAQYDYLLFIDSDSSIPVNYIRNYTEQLAIAAIIYGGTSYSRTVPNADRLLRWKYGITREEYSPKQRIKAPYKNIHYNNTLIKKEIFTTIKFHSALQTYGHEDTLFSYEAMKKNVKIRHIDNPVQHDGIDLNTVFIKKTNTGLANLYQLYQEEKIDGDFIKFLHIFELVKKTGIAPIIKWLFSKTHHLLIRNLNSKTPSLLLFDLYKLGYFCTLKTTNK